MQHCLMQVLSALTNATHISIIVFNRDRDVMSVSLYFLEV